MTKHLRRTILSSLGTLAPIVGFASAETETGRRSPRTTDDTCPTAPSRCDRCASSCEEKADEPPSVIYAENKSTCQRKVLVSTDEETFGMQVPGDDWREVKFHGSMRRLDIEDGDVDVHIEQRTEQKANHCE